MPRHPNNKRKNQKKKLPLPESGGGWLRFGLYLLLALVLLWLWQDLGASQLIYRTIPYSAFKEHLKRGEVVEVTLHPDEIIGRIRPKPAAPTPPSQNQLSKPSASKATAGKEYLFRTIRVEDPDLVKELEAHGVKFAAVRPSFLSQLLVSWVLPLAILFGLWMLLARRLDAAGQSFLTVGKSRARLIMDKNVGVKFDDVAGCEEAKTELREVVDFLKHPKRYEALGARVPKGILLVGPPGTGKTLLARAVAGEAGVPFFSISGSDFVEMFVGVGAARVRDLFREAKQHAPCIIFIDELDAIGRHRSVHVGPANDEREQTLNALLVEMDGFEPNSGVVILAATNRPDVLDRALLRPGRFDRQIVVDTPDLEGRKAILRVHARNKPLAPDTDLDKIAAMTAGFSGAELANVLNEAALLAARRGAKQITQADLEAAVEKVIAGPERRSRHLSPEVKRRVAIHEAGHALVAAYTPGAPPVRKITIVPRGAAALGYTMQLPQEDAYLLTRSELIARIKTLLGGRAAEELVLGEVSTGAQNDLEQATNLVRQMVTLYGMSSRLGLAHYAQKRSMFLDGQDAFQLEQNCSEETAREIDVEVRDILNGTYNSVLDLLREHREELDRVAAALLAQETLDQEAFERLLDRSKRSNAESVSSETAPAEPSTQQTQTENPQQRKED